MKQIELTQGKFVLVDDGDFVWASQWRWYANKCNHGAFYACRCKRTRPYIVYLHREILSATQGQKVLFRNGNTLDCRRQNLQLQNLMPKRPKRFGGLEVVYADAN